MSEGERRGEKKKKMSNIELIDFCFFRTLTNSIDHEKERVCGRFENRKKTSNFVPYT